MKPAAALAVTLVYLILAYTVIRHHEVWIDEAQHLLLARDSHSLRELFYNLRYEGHPFLFDTLIYVVIHASGSITAVQLMNLLFSAACVFLILKYAPFPLAVKLLICFGYFLLFEYTVICRNYSISLFGWLGVLIYMTSNKKNYLLLFFLIALLVNTHLFSAVLGIALVTVLWHELMQRSKITKVLCLLLFFGAIALSLIQSIPPNDHFMYLYNQAPAWSTERMIKAMRMFLLGLFPVPDLSHQNFWSNNFISDLSNTRIIILFLMVFVVSGVIFRNSRKALLLFYSGSCLLFICVCNSPLMPAVRHGGFVDMLLLAACWIRQQDQKDDANMPFKYKPVELTFFGSILIIQFVSGIMLFYGDLTHKFSNSETTAQFLNTTVDDRTPIVLTHFTGGATVALYSRHPVIYLENNDHETFCKWNTQPVFLNDQEMITRLRIWLAKASQLVLVSDQKNTFRKILSSDLSKSIIIKQLASFQDGMIQAENFNVYLLKNKAP